MYSIANIKKISLIVAVVGVLLYVIGVFLNANITTEDIEHHIHEDKIYLQQKGVESGHVATHSSHVGDAKDHQAHLHHSEVQVHNKPWAALLMAGMLFFGLSAASLFFFSIQHAAQAGWSIVVTRIMEGIASFMPIGIVIMLIVVLTAAFHLGGNHLYHWMDPELTQLDSEHYDFLLDSKKPFLYIPYWLTRIAIYFSGALFFLYKLKSLTKRLDENPTHANQKSLYNWSVGYIVFFALSSAAWAWDFLMSIDPHWYSTLYIWYTMVSCLVTGVAFMIIFSNMMKANGKLPLFNDNHQHDLTKFMFGFSLLWTYLWFDQFMLIWYANIPEETIYFLGRFMYYKPTYFVMLIPNFIMPLLILISSSIKRNSKVVIPMTFVVIFGHIWDFFNIIYPGAVGPYWTINFGPLEFGAFFAVLGIFVYFVTTTLSKMNLEPKGNFYFEESKKFEYPF